MTSYYDVGTKAWQPDQTEGWVASEVTQKVVDGDNVKLVFELENGEVRQIKHSDKGDTDNGQWHRREKSKLTSTSSPKMP